MTKLYFYYSCMSAGKTTSLIQTAYNYNEMSMNALVLNTIDYNTVSSRTGIDWPVDLITSKDESLSLFDYVKNKSIELSKQGGIHCILVDEAQFLKTHQVYELEQIVDDLKIPVICYGLRTDSNGDTFEGSAALLSRCDEIIEIQTICECGSKATMQRRYNKQTGRLLLGVNQVSLKEKGKHYYKSFCRKCWKNEK